VENELGTPACPAALSLGRRQAALLVNPYHTGQAVPCAAVGFLLCAMHDFSGEVVPTAVSVTSPKFHLDYFRFCNNEISVARRSKFCDCPPVSNAALATEVRLQQINYCSSAPDSAEALPPTYPGEHGRPHPSGTA